MSNNLFEPDNNVNTNQGPTLGRLLKVGFAVWCVWAVIVLAGVAGLGYVAWHFISKVW
jgi:hypothetical protein